MSEAAPKKVVAKTVQKKAVKKVVTKQADKEEGAPKQEVKFALSKFSPVYIKMFQGDSQTCSVCRFDLIELCPNCQVTNQTDPCPVQIGFCGHKFHLHCIQGWLSKGHDTCPLCQAKWEVADN